MAIVLKLSDATDTATLVLPEVPLVIKDSNRDVQNVTLDNKLKIFLYPGSDKLVITHTWKYLSIDEYNVLRGFRTRQRSTGNFPTLSITGLNEDITDIPVYLDMGDKNIIDNCETVQDVALTFRGS